MALALGENMIHTRVRYIGEAFRGQYDTAEVFAEGDGWVLVQFDQWGGGKLSHGRHRLPQSDFENMEDYPSLPEVEEVAPDHIEQRGRIFYDRRAYSPPRRDTGNTETHVGSTPTVWSTATFPSGRISSMRSSSMSLPLPREYTTRDAWADACRRLAERNEARQEAAQQAVEMNIQWTFEHRFMSDEELAS